MPHHCLAGGTAIALACLSALAIKSLVESRAIAQTVPLVRPPALTIVGTKGGIEQRTLVLRLPNADTPVNIYTFDIYNSDSTVVFPSQAIEIPLPATAKRTNEFISIPVTFDLTPIALPDGNYIPIPSGEFTGELLLTYEEAGENFEVSIPLIVRVKDSWPLPLLLLVMGVILGMTVSSYSSGGRLSDEVTVRLNRLQAQIRQYGKEAQPFANRAGTFIADARHANDAKQLEEARLAASQARDIWRKWYRQKDDWHNQLVYHGTLTQQVEKELAELSTHYVQVIRHELDDLMRTIPDLPNPSELQSKLRAIAQQLRDYGQMRNQFEQLKEAIAKRYHQLSTDEQKDFDENMFNLENEIYTLTPDKEGGVSTLATNIQKVRRKLNASISTTYIPIATGMSESSEEGDRPKPKNRSDLTFIPEPIQVPQTSPRKISGLPKWVGPFITNIWPDADGRLRGFYAASYIISVVLLAGGGFNELYIAKPTFGANAWGDYFALLAWGFGAEAARNTVTQVLRNTSEPDDSGRVVIQQVAQTSKTEMLITPKNLPNSESHESPNGHDSNT
ncbi:MAG: hypothetical protein VKL39_04325 [Leptolyngbyaceae bacterium]|nr:hypothetical protein [Leptolyngbyaceae bacterium]